MGILEFFSLKMLPDNRESKIICQQENFMLVEKKDHCTLTSALMCASLNSQAILMSSTSAQ